MEQGFGSHFHIARGGSISRNYHHRLQGRMTKAKLWSKCGHEESYRS